MAEMWPFFLLIAVFVGFSVVMIRVMGSSKGGSYTDLMRRQSEAMEAQVAVQADQLAEARKQTEALTRIADALEQRG